MFLELIHNVALLIALAVGLRLLARRFRQPFAYALTVGLLFGLVGVVAMMTPMRFAPGVLIDGRSMVLALTGLFGGPLAAAAAVLVTTVYRLIVGGAGAFVGVLIILESAAVGTALHIIGRRDRKWLSVPRLWLAGLLVHAVMVLLLLLLPEDLGPAAVRQVGPTIIVFYPLAFVLLSRVFLEIEDRLLAEEALSRREAELSAMFECSPLALYAIDREGTVLIWNAAAERIFGWSAAEAVGRRLPIAPGDLWEETASLITRVLDGGSISGLEVERRRRDGSVVPISLAAAPLHDEDGRPVAIFSAAEDITVRRAAAEAVRENEERFRSLVEGAPDAIFVQTGGRFAYINAAARRLFGAAQDSDLLGQEILARVHPDHREAVVERIRATNEDLRSHPPIEEVMLRLDGSTVPVEVSAVPTVHAGLPGAIVFARDISERHELERKYMQSQKMESVGRLAGGIAHDFNNKLQTILGYIDLLALEDADPEKRREHIALIRQSAERAADLTRQLLGFARKQTIEPRVVDLNVAVGDLLKMLERLIGEEIDLRWVPGRNECLVYMDVSQIDQILTNLVVNARDAITGIGEIVIETSSVEFDEEYCRSHPGSTPGSYVMLTVSDDGCGMDKATAAQAFEPFFTTKARNKGTGLGLATVFGIVKQNRGFAGIYSEPGMGTTLRVYLPRQSEKAAAPRAPAQKIEAADGMGELILLVEDDAALLELSRRMLESLGYRVLPAGTPGEALRISEEYAGSIDMLMSDVIMPEMSGRDLHDRIVAERPDICCLFMSGYTHDIIADRGVLAPGVHFLQKPFVKADLARKLTEILSTI